MSPEPKSGVLFSNRNLISIEAAIHAFLSDAAGFRDLIAEAVWRLLLRESTNNVTTLATLLKKTKNSKNFVVQKIHEAGADGGWLKNLTDLRNSVVHIAPIANTHEIHMIEVRPKKVGTFSAPLLHYPLTTLSGGARERPSRVQFQDLTQARDALERYRNFVAESGDALEYAANTFDRLIELATQVRLDTGLKSEMLALTDADIIGPVVWNAGVS